MSWVLVALTFKACELNQTFRDESEFSMREVRPLRSFRTLPNVTLPAQLSIYGGAIRGDVGTDPRVAPEVSIVEVIRPACLDSDGAHLSPSRPSGHIT